MILHELKRLIRGRGRINIRKGLFLALLLSFLSACSSDMKDIENVGVKSAPLVELVIPAAIVADYQTLNAEEKTEFVQKENQEDGSIVLKLTEADKKIALDQTEIVFNEVSKTVLIAKDKSKIRGFSHNDSYSELRFTVADREVVEGESYKSMEEMLIVNALLLQLLNGQQLEVVINVYLEGMTDPFLIKSLGR